MKSKQWGVDGAFCTSDSLALGLIDGLKKNLGVEIPRDFGVIGFDNISRSRENWLPLTTINQDVIKKRGASSRHIIQSKNHGEAKQKYPSI